MSLVSVPVQAFNAAAKQETIHFHQLHADCHRRIRYQKVCPVHGEVSNNDIVSAYEYSKGRYVEIESEELDKLRTEQDHQLTIDNFIQPEDIDSIYYDGRVYYLVPDGEQARASYAVLKKAIEKQGLYGIGHVVFSGKEQLVVIRPLDGLMAMLMLNFENQVRTPELFRDQLPQKAPADKEVAMAEKLIAASTEENFDFSQYEDEYTKKLRALIEAKVEGEELVAPEVEAEEPEVINLMDALKKSVARVQNNSHGSAADGQARRAKSKASGKRKRQAS